MMARHFLALSALLAFLPASAFANSYAFGELPKEELPAKADKFNSQITTYGREQTKRLSRESLDHFLEHGTWHYHNPYYQEMKKLGPDWQQWYLFKEVAEDERTEKQQAILDTYVAYNQKPEMWGAFTNEKGRVFLFRLRSPQFLEIQSGGICYLFLEADNQIELDSTEDDRALTEIPDLNMGSLKISGGPLPATGSFAVIPKDVIHEFLTKGTISNRKRSSWRGHSSSHLTSYWLEDNRLVTNPTFTLKQKDQAGNWILGATVNGIFHGQDDNLWFCEMLSDALLLLDNGEGKYAIIEHPQAVADRAGERE